MRHDLVELGLKDGGAPGPVKEGISKADAEWLRGALENAGANAAVVEAEKPPQEVMNSAEMTPPRFVGTVVGVSPIFSEDTDGGIGVMQKARGAPSPPGDPPSRRPTW